MKSNIHLFSKLYVTMMAVEVPVAAVVDVLMGGWGLSTQMLAAAWGSVLGVETLSYWAAVFIVLRKINVIRITRKDLKGDVQL